MGLAPCSLIGGDEFLEGGPGTQQESLARFSQAYTARHADEKSGANARLERTHRLADRGRSHPEVGGRSAKVAVPGNAQKRLHAVECALPDCEVLFHGSLRLSRIVARSEGHYIERAPQEQRRCLERPISFAASPPQPSSEPHQCPINPPPRHKSQHPRPLGCWSSSARSRVIWDSGQLDCCASRCCAQ